MVEFFGHTESTDVEDNQLISVFRIPAFTEEMARRRARINTRAKDMVNVDINDVEQVDTGDIPGQKIYDVTAVSDR